MEGRFAQSEKPRRSGAAREEPTLTIDQALELVKSVYPNLERVRHNGQSASFRCPWRCDRHPSGGMFLARDGRTWILKDFATGEMMTLRDLLRAGRWGGWAPKDRSHVFDPPVPQYEFERPDPYPTPPVLTPSPHITWAVGPHFPHDFTETEEGTVWFLRPFDDLLAKPVNAILRYRNGGYRHLGPAYPSAWVSPIPDEVSRILVVEGMTSATAVYHLLQDPAVSKRLKKTVVVGIPGKAKNIEPLAQGVANLAYRLNVQWVGLILDQDAEPSLRTRWQAALSPIPLHQLYWDKAISKFSPRNVKVWDGYDLALAIRHTKTWRAPRWWKRKTPPTMETARFLRVREIVSALFSSSAFASSEWAGQILSGHVLPDRETLEARKTGVKRNHLTHLNVLLAVLILAKSVHQIERERVKVFFTLQQLRYMTGLDRRTVKVGLERLRRLGYLDFSIAPDGAVSELSLKVGRFTTWKRVPWELYLKRYVANRPRMIPGNVPLSSQLIDRWVRLYGKGAVEGWYPGLRGRIKQIQDEVSEFYRDVKGRLRAWNQQFFEEQAERFERLVGFAAEGARWARKLVERLRRLRDVFAALYRMIYDRGAWTRGFAFTWEEETRIGWLVEQGFP